MSASLYSISEASLYDITPADESMLKESKSLNVHRWRFYLRHHSDRKFVHTLMRIFTHDVKIEYIESKRRFLINNHSSASCASETLAVDLQKQRDAHRIVQINKILSTSFISSSLDLISKADEEWKRIHDLSNKVCSINDCISDDFDTLKYFTFDDVIETLQLQRSDAIMIKRDLKNAFRYVLITRSDWWLLDFFWTEVYYIDKFLSFGLRTL